jgi:hypothetical protein
MERFWNLIYYFAYRGDYKLHLFFNKINPILWFYRLNYFKRRFTKQGIDDPIENINKSFKKLDGGISSFRAGGFMILLSVLFCFGIGNICIGILRIRDFNNNIFILILPVVLLFNYFLLFRYNKYLRYFKEFEKMDKVEKKKWGFISLITITGLFIFSVCSFIFMDYRV